MTRESAATLPPYEKLKLYAERGGLQDEEVEYISGLLAAAEARGAERAGDTTIKADVEAAALEALRDWRTADRELFVAKAVYESGGKSSALYSEVLRLKKAEEEKRALLMAAADSLPPRGPDGG